MSRVRVTDHAVLRHLERVGGVDIETLRTAIAASLDRAATTADAIGEDTYDICQGGFRYRIVGRSLVTVLYDHGY